MFHGNPPSHLEPPTCDDRRIWDVWLSTCHGPTLAAADEIGLFAHLERGPLNIAELAHEMKLAPRSAEAALGLLTALGFLVQIEGRFHLTELSRNYLLPTSPYYWGGFLKRFREAPISSTALRDALRRGVSEAKEAATEVWATSNREKLRTFTDAMHSHAFASAAAFAARFDTTGVRRFLDVAGGSGCFCIALAARHPDIRCTVMDLPVVCEFAQEYAETYRVQDRVDTHGADMFAGAWPKGYDVIFFNDIFHDWDDERCLDLARRSFEALPPGGRILVHEIILSDGKDGPLPAAAYSMAMMFSTHGKQRTGGELRRILEEAGFGAVTVTPSTGYYSLLSGMKR